MRISLYTPDYATAWKLNLTPRQAARVDNGRMISCGLTLGEDVQPSTLKRWVKAGIAKPTDAATEKHSGCQSRCILRGDSLCQW